MKINKHLIFSSTMSLLLAACATGPVGDDYTEYLEKPNFESNFQGKILVVNETGYEKGDFNFNKNPSELIVKEIQKSGREFVESENGNLYKFTYHKCTDLEKIPTRFSFVNYTLQVLTLGILKTGQKKSCQVDLIVSSNENNLELGKYSATFEFLKGGSIKDYYFKGGRTLEEGSWQLPARRLLEKHLLKVKGLSK